MRNLRTGAIQETTFRGGERIERAHIERKRMQYLYPMGDTYVFMDNESYEQLELTSEQVKAALPYMLENMEVSIADYNGEILGIELPTTVVLTIVEADPGCQRGYGIERQEKRDGRNGPHHPSAALHRAG